MELESGLSGVAVNCQRVQGNERDCTHARAEGGGTMSDPITQKQLERRLEETYTTEQQWERKGASFSLYAPKVRGSGPRLLVKQPSRWNADNAAIAFTTLNRCREAAARRGEPHFVARPYWWGADPPFLCVEWIEGEDLRSFIAEGLARDRASSWLFEALTAAGALLARYHLAVADSAVATNDAETIDMHHGFTAVARRIAGPVASSTEIPVRTLSDPSAGNIVIDERGRWWLIDLPDHVEVRALQWDVAKLAYRLGRTVDRASRPLAGRLSISYGAVFDAVRTGYASQLPGVLASEPSIGLFYSFLACEATRRLARPSTVRGKLALGAMTARMVGRSLVAVGRARVASGSSEPVPHTAGAQFRLGSAAPTPTDQDDAEESR